MLNVFDEFTPECLAIRVARKLKAIAVTQRGLMTDTRSNMVAISFNGAGDAAPAVT